MVLIPLLNPLCPVKAFEVLNYNIPASPSHSVFDISPLMSPPSQRSVYQVLSHILHCLNIHPATHIFHCFCQSGATFTFNDNISFQPIKTHSTWSLDSMHLYIASSLKQTTPVAFTFHQLLFPNNLAIWAFLFLVLIFLL